MSKLKNIKIAFGGATSPNVLTASQIDAIIASLNDDTLESVQYSGYVKLNSGTITASKKNILAKNNVTFVGNTSKDVYDITLDKNVIGTNDSIAVTVDGEVSDLAATLSVRVTSGDVTEDEVKGLITFTGNTFVIAPLRKAFGAEVSIEVYPEYDPTNVKTASFTINNVMAIDMTIEGEMLVKYKDLGDVTKHYTFTFSPSDYTMQPVVPVVTCDNARVSNVTLEGFDITFSFSDEEGGIYIINAVSENMGASYAVVAQHVAPIEFADESVKEVLLNNGVDTDGDGEINAEEMAAVTDIVTWFQGNTTIKKFDELSYCGVTELREFAFSGCTSLESIDLSNIVKINRGSLAGTAIRVLSVPKLTSYSSDYGNGILKGCKVKAIFMPSLTVANNYLTAQPWGQSLGCNVLDFGKNVSEMYGVFSYGNYESANTFNIILRGFPSLAKAYNQNLGCETYQINYIFVHSNNLSLFNNDEYWSTNYIDKIAVIGGEEWATTMQQLASEEGYELKPGQSWSDAYIDYDIFGVPRPPIELQ